MRFLDHITDNMSKGSEAAKHLGGALRGTANAMTAGGFSAFNRIIDHGGDLLGWFAEKMKAPKQATIGLADKIGLSTTATKAFNQVSSTSTSVTAGQREKIARLMGAVEGFGGKLDATTVKTVQNMMAVGDESRAIQILNEKINGLPAMKQTRIKADTSSAMSSLQAVSAVLAAIPRTVTTRYQIAKNISDPRLRAEGGPVSPRELYLVGEKGPELFVPDRRGDILPNSSMVTRGGGSRPASSGSSGRPSGGGGAGGGASVPSLRGIQISGVLETPWGPAEVRAMVADEITEEAAFAGQRARQRRAG